MVDVRQLYQGYLQKGLSAKDAAVQAQRDTGHSVVTGQAIKQKKLKFTRRGISYGGQYTLPRKI